MNFNFDRKTEKTARVRRLLVTALALGCAFGTVNQAAAQKIASPTTPPLITPPAGHSAFLVGHAFGTQGYICLPKATDPSTASWTVKGARPEATLFLSFFGQDFQIITHFLKVWAQVPLSNLTTPPSPAAIPAGSDPSCPNAGSIACLLLQSIGNQQGPTGGKILAKTTFVQRLNTKGGSAPDDADGCGTTANVGNQRLVPYTSDYWFFRKDE